ncbi:MAG: hypothetical protein GF350_14310 [Chitinivibrionales bacterium]|nr:hypothetical protein [Chitinivibrionales bacterium]
MNIAAQYDTRCFLLVWHDVFRQFLFCIAIPIAVSGQTIPVFPGAEGFGTTTPAGRGGEIIKVTTLDASGPGSLKEAIDASGKRTIVFEVGGIIDLRPTGNCRHLAIRNPYCTIAGQTAPSPGITIIGYGIQIHTHDVLVQHLAIRNLDHHGPGGDCRHSFYIQNASNVVIDHCTCTWSPNKLISTWSKCNGETHDITVSNTILAENFNCAGVHSEGCHSKGFLLGDGSLNVTIKNCLFSDNWDRNPAIKGGSTSQIVNNIVYYPGEVAIVITEDAYCGSKPVKTSIVGNVLKSGRKTRLIYDYFIGPFHVNSSDTRIYAHDNLGDTNYVYTQHPQWYPPRFEAFNPESVPPECIASSPEEAAWTRPMTVLSSDETYEHVLRHAGYRVADNDTIDSRIVNEVVQGWGMILDSLGQVPGGMPEYPSTNRELSFPDNYNSDDDGDGYTNLEEILHEMAEAVQGLGRDLTIPLQTINNAISDKKPYICIGTDKLKLPSLEQKKRYSIVLLSPDGRIVRQLCGKTAGELNLSTRGLHTGIYLIQISSTPNSLVSSTKYIHQ